MWPMWPMKTRNPTLTTITPLLTEITMSRPRWHNMAFVTSSTMARPNAHKPPSKKFNHLHLNCNLERRILQTLEVRHDYLGMCRGNSQHNHRLAFCVHAEPLPSVRKCRHELNSVRPFRRRAHRPPVWQRLDFSPPGSNMIL